MTQTVPAPTVAPNPVAALVRQPAKIESAMGDVEAALGRVPEVIPDDETHGRVALFIKQCRAWQRDAEDERKAIVGPINEGVKRINAKYKAVTDRLAVVLGALNQRSTAYLTAKESAQRAAAEAARRAQEELALAEAAKLEAAGHAEAAAEVLDQGLEIAPVAVAAGALRTAEATTSLRDSWEWDVVDPAAVPRQYLEINTKEVNAAVKGGAREIPGLRIFNNRKAVTR